MIEKILSWNETYPSIQFKTNILVSLAAYTITEIVDFWPRTERRKAVFLTGAESRVFVVIGLPVIFDSERDVWWGVKVKWFNFPVWKLVPLQRIQSRLSSPYHSKFQIGKSQSTKLFRHFFFLFIHLSSTFEKGAGRPVKLSHKYSGALQNISFFPLSHKSDWKMYKIFNK